MAYYKAPPKDDVKVLKERLTGDFVGGYLFHGEEEYLKNFYREEFRKIIKNEGMPEFNLVTVAFEKDGTLSDIEAALETPPMMAPHKLIEITGLEILSLKKDEEKRLVEMLERRADDTIIIFTFYSDELDLSVKKNRERKIIKDLSEHLLFTEFPRQKKEKLLSWADNHFVKESLHIHDIAIEKMIELCDYSMTRLKNEIEKLICRAKFEGLEVVPAEWVTDMVKPTAENELYELTDAIACMNTLRAASIYENLVLQNFEPVVVFGAISKTVCSLAVLWSARETGVRVADAAQASGLFPWQAEKYYNLLSSRTARGIRASVEACDVCDRRLKGEWQNKTVLLNTLIVTLTSEECK